jgi:hypothetical protein
LYDWLCREAELTCLRAVDGEVEIGFIKGLLDAQIGYS